MFIRMSKHWVTSRLISSPVSRSMDHYLKGGRGTRDRIVTRTSMFMMR